MTGFLKAAQVDGGGAQLDGGGTAGDWKRPCAGTASPGSLRVAAMTHVG